MPCLRTRFNYSAVYLGDKALGGKSIVEGMIGVKSKSGDRRYLWFDGFMDIAELERNHVQVKLQDIEAYTEDYMNSRWIEFGKNAQCLGVFTSANSRVKCILVDSAPIVWCDLQSAQKAVLF